MENELKLDNTSYEFTILIRVNEDENNKFKAIDSIINQSMDFLENIQLIILCKNPINLEIISQKYEGFLNNIILLEYNSDIHPYFFVYEYIRGKYISLIESTDVLSLNALKTVYNHITDNSLVILPVYLAKSNFDKILNKNFKKDEVVKVNLENSLNLPFVSLDALFFRKELISELLMNNTPSDMEDFIYLNSLLCNSQIITLIDSAYYSKENFDKNNILYDLYNFNYNNLMIFLSQLSDLTNNYTKEDVDNLDTIYYNIVFFISQLIKTTNLNSLQADDKKIFFNLLKTILVNIPENIIYRNEFLTFYQKTFLFYLMDNKRIIEYNDKKDDINLTVNNQKIDSLLRHKIWLDIVDIKDNHILLSGMFNSHFSNENISITLIIRCDDKLIRVPVEEINYPQNERKTVEYLSISWYHRFNFNIEIPLKFINDLKLFFEVEYDDVLKIKYTPQIEFRTNTNLSYLGIYFVKENYILFHDSKSMTLIKYNYSKMFRLELRNIYKIYKSDKKNKSNAIFIRLLYLILYPYMHNQKIWLINDRKDCADDNAIYLFRYALEQNDGIKKYYVIDGKCDDYYKLNEKYDKILKYGSLKHKIIYLFTQKRISSFLNESFFNPFYNKDDDRLLYNNLVTSPRYFLQHGVISCDLTNHIKRFNHNLNLIVTSADAERQSFYDLDYNYSSDVVQALGLPRYDYLKSGNIQRQILYIPSWRSYLNNNERKLESSVYYKSIMKLLKNKRLKQILEKYDYKFIFKPHPELVKHVKLFDENSYITIDTDSSFQKMFNQSQLLISDFSSVIYDFAYLEKPVIYYQPNDDYHFEKGYFDYQTMGFGKVINDEEELINSIEEYLRNNCQMEEFYKDKVKDFFKYHDKHNSQRVYEWIKNN